MADSLESYLSSLHRQVAESSRKLKDGLEKSTEPCIQLQTLTYEVDGLRLLLGDLAGGLRQHRFFSPSIKTAVLESLQACQSIVQPLQAQVADLEPTETRNLSRDVPRNGRDTKHVEELTIQVRQVKSTVLLAKCCYDGEVQRQYLSKILTAVPYLSKLKSLDAMTAEDTVDPHVTEEVNDSRHDEGEAGRHTSRANKTLRKFRRRNLRLQKGNKFLQGLLEVVTANQATGKSTVVSIGFPSWLFSWRWDVFLMRSYQGWDTSFRVYRTVDIDSSVFHYSMAGDVEGLERLFKEKKATPFDVDPEGRTPLHYATMYARPEVCRLLLREGADPNVRTSWQGAFSRLDTSTDGEWYPDHQKHVHSWSRKAEVWRGRAAYSTPLHLLTSIGGYLTYGGREELTWTHYESERNVTEDIDETVEVLTTKGDCDTLLEDQFGFTPFHLFAGRTESFAWLRRYEQVMLHNLSPEETWNILWSRMMNFGGWTGNPKVAQIREGIPGDKVPKHLARNFSANSPLSSCGSFLSMSAREWVRSREILVEALDEHWSSLLLEFLKHNADLHVVATDEAIPHTILMRLVHAALLPPKIDVSLVLRKWLHILVKAGIDLGEYGRAELRRKESGDCSWEILADMGTTWASLGYCKLEVLSLQTGENPEDWNIEWDLVAWDIPKEISNEAVGREESVGTLSTVQEDEMVDESDTSSSADTSGDETSSGSDNTPITDTSRRVKMLFGMRDTIPLTYGTGLRFGVHVLTKLDHLDCMRDSYDSLDAQAFCDMAVDD